MATKGDQYDTLTGNIWNYANRGDEAGVRIALERGVNINMQNRVGWTAAHAAARGNQVKMIQYLHAKGADLELTDNDGRLPVHEAARSGSLEALQMLHKLGCSLDAETNAGQTVMSLAKGDAVKKFIKTALSKASKDAQAKQQQHHPSGPEHQHTTSTKHHSKQSEQEDHLHDAKSSAAAASVKAGAGKGADLAWKKATPAGAAYSSKAKKEYLKWKREQKRGKGDDDSDDDDAFKPHDGIHEGHGSSSTFPRTSARNDDRKTDGSKKVGPGSAKPRSQAVRSVTGDDHHDDNDSASEDVGQADPDVEQRKQALSGAAGAGSESDAEIQEDDNGADDDNDDDDDDDDAQQQLAVERLRLHEQQQQQPEKKEKAPIAKGSLEDPIEYVPLVTLDSPAATSSAQQTQSSGESAASSGTVRMPRCIPQEVGFTEEGLKLGMPKRPTWKGVVHSAEELHTLEEASFKAWCQSINNAYEPGRVSFYERRLEFWRQLWRVLDLCHVALMIVDARNPLLDFSEALAAHVLREHSKPLILILNKSDLVPAASVAAWAQWFSTRHPGIHVIPCSAAAGGTDTGRNILQAVLDCTITYEGRAAKVSDFIQKSADTILQQSIQRNTVSKRGAASHKLAQQHEELQRLSTSESLQGNTDAGFDQGFAGDDSDDDEQDWNLKGNKAKKVGAVKKKRNARMAAGTQKQQAATVAVSGKTQPDEAGNRGKKQAGGSRGKASGASSRRGKQDEQDEGDAEDITDSPDSFEDGTSTDDNNSDLGGDDDLDRMEKDMFKDLVRQHQDGNGGGNDDEVTIVHTGTAAATASHQPHAQRQQGTGRKRKYPIVVCVVGEPNVGKSSTMNALLGAHKVAVSSHPGRTKHYQTHYMTDGLMLCDCPGLVFPRLDVPLSMQILYGSYPIAHCRDPYAVIRYLASHMWPRLHIILGLRKVDEMGDPIPGKADASVDDKDEPWSPIEICEAFAAKKSWKSRKGGRLDWYRAANFILRTALAGKSGVSLAFLPPGPEQPLPEVKL